MAIKGNYLYVPNSDGQNWREGYGTTASKINLNDFEATPVTFNVGLNPAKFVTNGTDLFLLCKGDYGDTKSQIYRISDDDQATSIAKVLTLFAIKDNNLYLINSPFYPEEGETVTYKIYNITTGETKDMITDEGVESAAEIAVKPETGEIFITSYVMDGDYASYSTPGYIVRYDANGNRVTKQTVGTGPCAIFF